MPVIPENQSDRLVLGAQKCRVSNVSGYITHASLRKAFFRRLGSLCGMTLIGAL